jgi:hypothetical protein
MPERQMMVTKETRATRGKRATRETKGRKATRATKARFS